MLPAFEELRMPKQLFLYALLVLILTACGGGGGGDDDDGGSGVSQGRFWDTNTEGLQYSTATQSGLTNQNGAFNYKEGETVTFRIGDIELGSLDARSIVTPIDLVGVSDPANDEVVNISRFLQTLDDDDDTSVSSGITITQAVRNAAVGKSINFNQTPSAFEMDSNVISVVAELTALRSMGARTLVDASTAQTHLEQTLDNIFLLALGMYTGTSFNSQTNCNDPIYNRSSTINGTLNLSNKTAGATSYLVSGTATFSQIVQGLTVTEEIVFTDTTVDFLGDMSGTADVEGFIDGISQGTGVANITGTLERNKIVIKFPTEPGKDLGDGIVCDISGTEITVYKDIEW